jgi:hypothetical protein
MNNVKIDKVDNGFIVSLTKYDFITKRPEVEVVVFKTMEEVITYVKEKF